MLVRNQMEIISLKVYKDPSKKKYLHKNSHNDINHEFFIRKVCNTKKLF